MRVTLQKAESRLPWPAWAVAVVTVWLGLVGAAVALAQNLHHDLVLCPFRAVIGIPCPTCGACRGVIALAAGDCGAALACNPLVFLLLPPLAMWLMFRAVTGQRIEVRLSRPERLAAVALGAAAIAANWAYVILHHRGIIV